MRQSSGLNSIREARQARPRMKGGKSFKQNPESQEREDEKQKEGLKLKSDEVFILWAQGLRTMMITSSN